ncbi:unnamed protein product, partial [Timema podura]|nr:unnamed protein product [Timema podura]
MIAKAITDYNSSDSVAQIDFIGRPYDLHHITHDNDTSSKETYLTLAAIQYFTPSRAHEERSIKQTSVSERSTIKPSHSSRGTSQFYKNISYHDSQQEHGGFNVKLILSGLLLAGKSELAVLGALAILAGSAHGGVVPVAAPLAVASFGSSYTAHSINHALAQPVALPAVAKYAASP